MIIIETPTEPTRERLVLVPPLACTDIVGKPGHLRVSLCDARDATPEDLARGGYVPQGSRQDLDCVISDLTAQVREAEERAEKAERERCLVTRAVAANVDIRVCEDDGGGFMVGVHVPNCDEDLERNVPAADVPATLARLLGEVLAEAKGL